MNELQTSLFVALIAGVGVWMVTTIIHFLVQRHYVKVALRSDVATKKERCQEIHDFLLRYAKENLSPGDPIELTAHITKSPTDLYDDLRPEIVSKVPSLIPRVSRFYLAVGEADQLLANLFYEVTILKKEGKQLDEEMYLYLLGKIGRIVGLAELVAKQDTERLRDLPSKYDGRVSPERMLQLLNGLGEADTLIKERWIALTPVKNVLPASTPAAGEPKAGDGPASPGAQP